MTLSNISAYHLTITVVGDTSIDTEITSVSGYPPKKYIVTYFEGTGTLEVSQDGNVWIDTTDMENTLIDVVKTLPRYFRISGAGDKVIHLTSI